MSQNETQSPDLSALEPIQLRALELLVQGSTVAGAARAIGIHRTTIHHWKRNNETFRQVLAGIFELRAFCFHEDLAELGSLATEALGSLITGVDTPAATRLRAIQLVLGDEVRRHLPAPSALEPAVDTGWTLNAQPSDPPEIEPPLDAVPEDPVDLAA